LRTSYEKKQKEQKKKKVLWEVTPIGAFSVLEKKLKLDDTKKANKKKHQKKIQPL
jgi:hypothetical protein